MGWEREDPLLPLQNPHPPSHPHAQRALKGVPVAAGAARKAEGAGTRRGRRHAAAASRHAAPLPQRPPRVRRPLLTRACLHRGRQRVQQHGGLVAHLRLGDGPARAAAVGADAHEDERVSGRDLRQPVQRPHGLRVALGGGAARRIDGLAVAGARVVHAHAAVVQAHRQERGLLAVEGGGRDAALGAQHELRRADVLEAVERDAAAALPHELKAAVAHGEEVAVVAAPGEHRDGLAPRVAARIVELPQRQQRPRARPQAIHGVLPVGGVVVQLALRVLHHQPLQRHQRAGELRAVHGVGRGCMRRRQGCPAAPPRLAAGAAAGG